jgi:hypothetical protein
MRSYLGRKKSYNYYRTGSVVSESPQTKLLSLRQRIGDVMGVCTIAIVFCIFSEAVVAAPISKQETEAAVAALMQQFPKFDWQADTAVLVDINADGIDDIAVLGYTKYTAAVGVVLGRIGMGNRVAKYLDFLHCGPDGVPAIYGCKGTLKVTKQSDVSKMPSQKMPEGYVTCDKCYVIEVVGNMGGAPIVIYWDTVTKDLNWWQAGLWGIDDRQHTLHSL